MVKVFQKAIISKEIFYRNLGDEIVLLHLPSGSYYYLDGVGARMWDLISRDYSFNSLCDVLIREYEVERDVLERDVLRLAFELQEKGLIVCS